MASVWMVVTSAMQCWNGHWEGQQRIPQHSSDRRGIQEMNHGKFLEFYRCLAEYALVRACHA